MNFHFQRNPRRLMALTGCETIRNRTEERTFLARLRASEPETVPLRPLVLVIGGFLDQLLANSYAVSRLYPDDLRARHDVFFREHAEGRDMRILVEHYAGRGLPVALIGHSWGGDAAVNAVAAKTAARIDLLITLDPVSRKGPPAESLPNVGLWLNIHVDYAAAALCNVSNMVGRIGGPWQAVRAAHRNVACPRDVDHAHAIAMFRRCGEAALRETLP